MLVNLDEGLGVSLVNKVPEELVFATLSGVNVHFTRTAANEVLELSIQNIQVRKQERVVYCAHKLYFIDDYSKVRTAPNS